MQLFGGRFNLIMEDGQQIRSNFDTFVQALMTVFQVTFTMITRYSLIYAFSLDELMVERRDSSKSCEFLLS